MGHARLQQHLLGPCQGIRRQDLKFSLQQANFYVDSFVWPASDVIDAQVALGRRVSPPPVPCSGSLTLHRESSQLCLGNR